MAESTETRCLNVNQLLTEAYEYYRAAKDCGDMASIAKWEEAMDCLLDRMNQERAAA